ncbi:MAG: pentapeptide repeat-containing protein [Saprospiraceae bacterium]|nr:pentapeptide repeat-containing protein [Saprospiraceae bacterium]MCF8252397.1 pentapeptide repeat-containing protein [Saprospiraceae bacterium]MCF8282267.1 pentapeptide repeat-containing protein [Bacteroidales bacterium]MCF8313979.1 pentapeptide repeat-containing protein [Saprospiraceae bacterium]MCF8442727.1 pentapeptide repeat-containing protein [Saprospiraceae bacterium]
MTKVILISLSIYLFCWIAVWLIKDAFSESKPFSKTKLGVLLLSAVALIMLHFFGKKVKKTYFQKIDWFYKSLFFGSLIFFIVLDYVVVDNWEDFLKNILVEAHGFIFDLLIFGIIFTIYQEVREKKESIKRYLEELEDFRRWQEPEASFRIAGIVRRLNRIEKYDLDLDGCNLENSDLKNLRFDYSKFYGTNLSGSDLRGAKFNGAYFNSETNLEGALVDSKEWFISLKDEQLAKGIEYLSSKYEIVEINRFNKTYKIRIKDVA